jgi:hypothetical protein
MRCPQTTIALLSLPGASKTKFQEEIRLERLLSQFLIHLGNQSTDYQWHREWQRKLESPSRMMATPWPRPRRNL